ncbi:MAG TPA: T9SS type A sorting domain-containing protein [Chitinophagales bacterium]|nr:T9SS type A sorting domain-containing protein [Chitinophagales bacterium]
MKKIHLLSISLFALISISLLDVQTTLSQAPSSMGLSIQKTLSPTWLGYNGQSTVRNGESWNEPNLMAKLPALKPKVLRYPAGGNSNWWDWKRGWFVNSPNLPSNYAILARVSNYLENFKITKDSCHAEAILSLNMVTSTLQDQMAMLRHADSIGLGVKFVELGNEFYIQGTEDDSGPGIVYVDSVFHYVKTYADMCNIWIDTIHHYFPNCKVAVQGCFEKNNRPKRVKWNDSMQLLINHREDVWTYHTYFGSHWMDSTATAAEKAAVTIDEVEDWMYQPFKGYGLLANASVNNLSPGKEIWITEYNMTDKDRPVGGLWGHGLYLPLQSMLFLNDERIKMLTPWSIDGSAAYGQYFFSTNGFLMGGESDAWTTMPNPPTTVYWGLTASGNTMKMLGEAADKKTFASPLVFTPVPQVTVVEVFGTQTRTYDGVYGWLFSNSTGSDAMILNLTGTPVTIATTAFFTTGTYVQKYANPLAPIANSTTDVTTLSGTLPATLVLQPYSATKITSSFVPAAPPTASIQVDGAVSICSGDSVQLEAPTGFVNYVWSTGATTRTIWVKSTGDYGVHVYALAAGYYGAATVHITVNPLPYTPTISVTNYAVNICQGFTTELVANQTYNAYLWSNGGTTNSITVGTTGDYTLTGIDVNGCRATSLPKVITVYPLPTPVITAQGPTTFCADQSVILAVTTAYSTYYWSSGNYGQSRTITTAGSNFCTVTDLHGCIGNSNSIVTAVHTVPVPIVTTSTGALTFCANSGVYFSTSTTGYNYQWLMGGANISGATNQTYIPTASATYRVRLTDVYGCTNRSEIISPVVNAAANPVIQGTAKICQGQSTALNTVLSYSSYLWLGGATTSTATVTATGNYTVLVTNSNGCSGISAVPKTVTVNPLPTPTITAGSATAFCTGGNVILSVIGTYNPYLWSTGQFGQTHTYSESGTYSCMVTDTNGCMGNSNPITVTVGALPIPVVTSSTGSFTFCNNVGAYLTTSLSGYNYQWLKGTTVLTGASNQTYVPTSNGGYKVRITDDGGCTSTSVSKTITINLAPAPVITGSLSICQGGSTSLGANISGISYLWSNGATTQSIPPSTAGTFTVAVTDANACSGLASAVTTTVYSLPTVTITSTGSTTFCDGGNDSLKSNTASSYLWSNGKTTQAINVTASGTFTVTVTDSHGCSNAASPTTITEWILPTPDLTSSTGSLTFCDNSGAYLTTSVTGYSYQWLKGGNVIVGATAQNYIPTVGATYKVQITNGYGCTNLSAGSTIIVNVSPVPTITGSASICEGGSTSLSSSIAATSYHWSTGATTQSIPSATASTYTVTVTDLNGCTGVSPAVTTAVYALPTVTITSVGASDFCDGGSDSLRSSVASSYIWSNGKTARSIYITASGTFTVTVTDSHGCTKVSSPAIINEWILPEPVITAVGPTTYCKNAPGSYLSTVSGYSYQWLKGTAVQNGATGQTWEPGASGTYKVKITDSHGCSKTAATGVKVTVNKLPVASISNSGASNLCGGATVTLTETTATGNIYQWKNNGTSIAGATTSKYITGLAGTYTCFVTSTAGCTLTSNSITITNNCKMEDGQTIGNELRTTMNLYPNPAFDGIHINAQFASQASGEATLEIRNLLGEVMYSEKQTVDGGKYNSDILFNQRFSAGSYFVRITFDDDRVMQQFLIAKSGR